MIPQRPMLDSNQHTPFRKRGPYPLDEWGLTYMFGVK